MKAAFERIQPLYGVFVMALFALSLAGGPHALADDDFDDSPEAPAESTPTEESAPVEGVLTSPEDAFGDANAQLGNMPSIEAKIYDVKIVRPSRSGRVYLIQKNSSDMPEAGRIFLLKDSATPVMAFRVLKTYPDNRQIAAKRVRIYPGFDQLEAGAAYRAYEKKGNIAVVPGPSLEDNEDLMDLEQTPPPDGQSDSPDVSDSDSDVGNADFANPVETPSPAPTESEPTGDPGDQDVELRRDDLDDDDYSSYDYFPNWLTVPFGAFLGNDKLPGPATQKGTGLLYGRNMGSRAFTLEGGFYYYKTAGDVASVSKSYTLMPLVGMGRFNFSVSNSVIFYLYGGMQYKWIIGNLGATAKELRQIQVAAPLAGLGFFALIGPNWYLRLNLGIDSILGGISLKF